MEHKEQLLLIDTSHPHYPDVLQLRDDLLRKPLGLNLYLEDLSEEQHEMIFVYTINDQVQACVLLKPLSQQSITQAQKPFRTMYKKLPRPIQTRSRSLQKMNQGVTFFADEGTPVTAVYPGTVVFSDWLKGYGLLLIIDHGQGFMSLYAHNESLFKKKGQTARQNEQIASVGHSGGIKQNGLYFEIRLRGKAVPALDWLSRG